MSPSAGTASRHTWSTGSDYSRTTALSSDCSINRYYDSVTDSFISGDPYLQRTDQAYVFTNDNPLDATDPLGLAGWYCIDGVSHYYAGNQHGTATGKCKTKPAPTPPSAAKPPTSTTTRTSTSPGQSQDPTQNSTPSSAATQIVNQYISDTNKPWCYAGLGVGGSGAAGSELAVVYGANVDDPPAWLVTGFAIVNTLVVVTIIKVFTEC
jgi:RHS repeat-associated protein